jgi:hypothetical protein
MAGAWIFWVGAALWESLGAVSPVFFSLAPENGSESLSPSKGRTGYSPAEFGLYNYNVAIDALPFFHQTEDLACVIPGVMHSPRARPSYGPSYPEPSILA